MLADRVGIINRGRLVRVDARERLMREFGQRHVDVKLAGPVEKALLGKFEGLELSVVGDRVLRLVFHEQAEGQAREKVTPLERLLKGLLEEEVGIESIEGGRSSLEVIFRELVQSDRRGEV